MIYPFDFFFHEMYFRTNSIISFYRLILTYSLNNNNFITML